jgi:nicotinamidase-related amidase
MENRKALLVIDMQKGSFTPLTPRYDTIGLVTRINALTDLFRLHNYPVFFIQHDGSRFNEFIPGTNDWEILLELIVKDGDICMNKYANDIFYQSDIADELKALNINEIYITGCATDFCVESSIQSALVKDYHITVVKDGHTTADRSHLKAEKIIEHYNWVWQNMIPTNGSIKVIDFKNIIENGIY